MADNYTDIDNVEILLRTETGQFKFVEDLDAETDGIMTYDQGAEYLKGTTQVFNSYIGQRYTLPLQFIKPWVEDVVKYYATLWTGFQIARAVYEMSATLTKKAESWRDEVQKFFDDILSGKRALLGETSIAANNNNKYLMANAETCPALINKIGGTEPGDTVYEEESPVNGMDMIEDL